MCLAVPGQIATIDSESSPLLQGVVDVLGARRTVCLELLRTQSPAPGDWVLIHVGFALERISATEAAAQLKLLEAIEDAPSE